MDKSIFLLFLFAISLHNIEEALWLPAWSKKAKKFHKEVTAYEFKFAVTMVTLLAFLSTSLYVMFPEQFIIKYFYYGFLGAMIINVFVPHLAGTILLKKYAPGLITGLFLILPINIFILYFAYSNSIIDPIGIVISTAAVGIPLIGLLPWLFKLGVLIKEYETS